MFDYHVYGFHCPSYCSKIIKNMKKNEAKQKSIFDIHSMCTNYRSRYDIQKFMSLQFLPAYKILNILKLPILMLQIKVWRSAIHLRRKVCTIPPLHFSL